MIRITKLDTLFDFRSVQPCHPAAPYIGGKKQLAQAIAVKIETIPHEIYAEPFVGMGGVFLRRRFIPKSEVINDRSGDVVTFFRVLQRHYGAFMDELKFTFTSRAEFERLAAVDPASLTDIERAARFLYLQRLTFGGKVAGRTFGVSPSNPGRFDISRLGEILTRINERLAGVTIENLDWKAFLARYDRPGTLFYLDPPYWGSEDHYGRGLFPKSEFEVLAEALKGLAGSFVLSLNDVPEVRAIFSGFAIESVMIFHSTDGARPVRRSELIITR